jgi:hypothetical protein
MAQVANPALMALASWSIALIQRRRGELIACIRVVKNRHEFVPFFFFQMNEGRSEGKLCN